jgi:hypothetical protein
LPKVREKEPDQVKTMMAASSFPLTRKRVTASILFLSTLSFVALFSIHGLLHVMLLQSKRPAPMGDAEIVASLRLELDALRFELSMMRERDIIAEMEAPKSESDTVQMNYTDTIYREFQQHRPRTLLGIFSNFASSDELLYRKQVRKLLPLHPNLCHINDMQRDKDCEIIYTFVIGGRDSGRTQQLKAPFLLGAASRESLCESHHIDDCLHPDMTILNVRENSHQGKSPSWLAYGASIADSMNVEFIAKMDSDVLLYLDAFLEFTRYDLSPKPYSNNLMAGFLADQFWWKTEKDDYGSDLYTWMKSGNATEEDNKKWRRLEGPFISKYTAPLHYYPQGQFYLLSKDLCDTIAEEAARRPTYLHGREDHDIGAMAMIAATAPIKLVAIAESERFWARVGIDRLGQRLFDAKWQAEIARLQGVLAKESGKHSAKMS